MTLYKSINFIFIHTVTLTKKGKTVTGKLTLKVIMILTFKNYDIYALVIIYITMSLICSVKLDSMPQIFNMVSQSLPP